MNHRGFTLIELLVVVTIIAILAAIAVPNLLEAQTRAKVSRAYADMRSIATALEAYRVDTTCYPLAVALASQTILPHLARLKPLTTPIGYLTVIPPDIFRPTVVYSYLERNGWLITNRFAGEMAPTQGLNIRFFEHYQWALASVGPTGGRPDVSNGYGWEDVYDPTNGTISTGSPLRVGP